MRTYAPKDCILPKWAYRTVIEAVRGYDDMIKTMKEVEYDEIYTGLGVEYSAVKSKGTREFSRPTENKTLRIIRRNAEFERVTKAVDRGLMLFTTYEKDIILRNIVDSEPIPRTIEGRRDSTMERRKREFVYLVANNLNLL